MGGAGRSAIVDLREGGLDRSVRKLLLEDGWALDTDGRADIRVGALEQQARGGVHADVVIVDPLPAACARGIDAVLRGSIRGLVLAEDLDQLPAIAAAAAQGVAALSLHVIDIASKVPPLTARQFAALGRLLMGESNAEIGRRLNVSEATIKREVAALSRAFGTCTRLGTVSEARALGFQPCENR